MRCGDVHPHPGPLRVAHANVSSLRLHWHTVAEWRVDVVLPLPWSLAGGCGPSLCVFHPI